MLQCIGRKINSLPISILEVHTVVHVVCALGMYIFWSNKPLEIHDPMLLTGSEYEEILAYMMMVSPGLGLVDTYAASATLPESALLSFDNDLNDKGKSTARHGSTAALSGRGQKHHGQPTPMEVRDLDADFESNQYAPSKTHISLTSGVVDSESGFSWREALGVSQPRRSSTWSQRLVQARHPTDELKEHKMAREDIRRWRLSSRAIRQYPWLKERAKFSNNTQGIAKDRFPSDGDYIDGRIEDQV